MEATDEKVCEAIESLEGWRDYLRERIGNEGGLSINNSNIILLLKT